MTFSELQILLDINKENEQTVLYEHACLTDYGYLFVDSTNGQCYLLDKNGKLDDLKKIDAICKNSIKKDIKKIAIPNSVKSIGDWAFYGCTSLTSIEIPDSIESIGYKAFAFCESLVSIEIPNSVESIGYWTFGNYTSLKEVIFKGKTMDQVKAMDYYPWGIENEAIIKCQKS